jgi:hypothetical protein
MKKIIAFYRYRYKWDDSHSWESAVFRSEPPILGLLHLSNLNDADSVLIDLLRVEDVLRGRVEGYQKGNGVHICTKEVWRHVNEQDEFVTLPTEQFWRFLCQAYRLVQHREPSRLEIEVLDGTPVMPDPLVTPEILADAISRETMLDDISTLPLIRLEDPVTRPDIDPEQEAYWRGIVDGMYENWGPEWMKPCRGFADLPPPNPDFFRSIQDGAPEYP